MTERLKHDGLAKKVLSDPVAAREFLSHYLPESCKSLLDLNTLKIEKESYVEDNLKQKFSDLVFSIKMKNNQKAFIYTLVEAEVSPRYWTAFKLWKYMFLLLERHKVKNKSKLPLIIPLVVYHGNTPFTVPRNLWELFSEPTLAKEFMGGDYQLVDLYAMPDNEIKKKEHLGMLEYFMKYVHSRDILKLWEEFLENFKSCIVLDKEKGYIYIRSFLWYSDSKLPEDQQSVLENIITKHLPSEDKEDIMRTIAQKYRDEGIRIGEENGIRIGEENGIRIGEEKGKLEGKVEIAKSMLNKGYPVEDIIALTGLPVSRIEGLV
ncbi:MAG: Rpn family recombination-promoting nuclease/putative transposase [Candidatus Cardinium sp.]|uniref:Rpn family recombination-promoting nuclease/putative transposase n=1 Tax=Cardinium endosymbiont of Dermatophagoides farinae TaxID=2597823 RepID=UPI001182DBD6|nr:Rpn family recombination-promoting nuclease/putative transposase [Cardinium endosymbiont of Dermatophagoides farinae]TSJ81150.1 Rpn family recombination-promoting nuclease/putative transposase [Cardinium endosymbiont of Dermatophagoides farinae]UWW97198.1 MAG: Rpn family recombination-promoting nuclease/putative transposase [Candidatus Cardinium sp.]